MTNETVFARGFELLLSIKELAASLGINVQTLYDLRFRGRGPHGIRIGRELKFRRSEIEAWLRRMEEDDANRPGPGRQ